MFKACRSLALGGVGVLVLGLALPVWAGGVPASWEVDQGAQAQSAADYLPDGLALVVTVRDGAGLVGGLRQLLADYRFEETQAFAALSANPGFVAARVGLLGLAAAAGTDGWTALGSLAGDEIVLGVTPGKGPEARFIAISVSADRALRDRFLDQARTAVGLSRGGTPDSKRSRTIDGVTVFEMDNELIHGQAGPALIVSNSEALFRKALGAATAAAGLAEYRSSAERVPAGAAAWLWIDGAVIKAGAGPDGAAGLVTNPLGGLLFGGAWRSMLDAPSAVAWLSFAGRSAKVDLEVASPKSLPPTHRGFVSGASDGPGFDAKGLPGYVADMRIARDWAGLFAERESHLALPAAEQLVAFSSGLTALMGQMDFVDDVLPRFAGPVYLIAARQDLSPRGYLPSPVLPAFALVMPLKAGAGADGFAKRLYSASLLAMSAGSLIAAQQGQPPFIVDSDRYRDCRIVTADYDDPGAAMDGGMAMRPPAADEGADAADEEDGPARVHIRYNFAPAIGIVGERYVISTSADLLRTVIDSMLAEPAAGVRVEGDTMTIDGPALATVLGDNHEELVANRMLEENRTRAEAEGDIDAFLGLLRYAKGLSADYRQSPEGFVGSITLDLVEAPGDGARGR